MLLTRFELFLRAARITPVRIARRLGYTRQHVLRLRLGISEPTRHFIEIATRRCRHLARKPPTPGDLFERGDELLRTKQRRLSAMHAADRATLDALLREPGDAAWIGRVAATGILSETAVRHLLRHAHVDRDPHGAALVLEAAARMAARLANSPPELAASLQAEALKRRANALRHRGEFDAALADLAVAAKLFGAAKYCAAEAGQVEYARATILFKREAWDDALAAARGARKQFIAAGDVRRAAHADLLEAAVWFEQGDFRRARAKWVELQKTFGALRDAESLARVWLDLAVCDMRLGSPKIARHWLCRASGVFRKLDMRTELARARWNMATYITRFRSTRRGLRALHRAERAFLSLGCFTDAACVALEALDLMIDDGAADDALRAKAEETAGVLVQAGMRVSAAGALDTLRRVAVPRDRKQAIQDVRDALRDFDAECSSLSGSAAPPPEDEMLDDL